MSRMRKMRDDDRRILASVFRDHGADWTYKALAVWYGAFDHYSLASIRRWTRKRLAAYRFLREITRDYTFNAVYKAAEAVDGRERTTPVTVSA
jgi:hypothetical protein